MSQESRSKRVKRLPRRAARAAAAAMATVLALAGSFALAGKPVEIMLVGSDGETSSLRHRTERYRLTGVDGEAPLIAPVGTELLLEFTPTLVGGGRVAVSFHLGVTSGEDPADRGGRLRTSRMPPRSFEVNAVFEVNDGESIALEPVPAGQPVVVTTRIVQPAGPEPASMVFIEARLAAGAAHFRRDDVRMVRVARLVSLPDRPAAVEDSTLQYFAARPTAAVPIEAGSSLKFTASVSDETVGLAVGVRSRDVGRAILPVPGPFRGLSLPLPLVRTLDVQTSVAVRSGSTVVIGGIETARTNELVFLTPEIVDHGGPPLVLLESRVLTAAGNEPEVEGEPVRSEFFKEIDLATSFESAAAVSRTTERGFVTAFTNEEPVQSPLETGTRMQMTPVSLVADHVGFDLELSSARVDEPVLRAPVGTFGGAGHLDLASQRVLRVDTRLVVTDGQTVLAAGIEEEVVREGLHTRGELLVFATPRLGELGAPEEIAVEARVVGTSESRGRSSSGPGSAGGLVERLECGPVESP